MRFALLKSYQSCYATPAYSPGAPVLELRFSAPLTFKQFLKTDCRGVVALVVEEAELRLALDFRAVPHYSTLCYGISLRVLTHNLMILRCWVRSISTKQNAL